MANSERDYKEELRRMHRSEIKRAIPRVDASPRAATLEVAHCNIVFLNDVAVERRLNFVFGRG